MAPTAGEQLLLDLLHDDTLSDDELKSLFVDGTHAQPSRPGSDRYATVPQPDLWAAALQLAKDGYLPHSKAIRQRHGAGPRAQAQKQQVTLEQEGRGGP